MNDECKLPGGDFKLELFKNKKEAGIDILSRIKKFFGLKIKLYAPLASVEVHNKMTNDSLAVLTGLAGNTGGYSAFTYLEVGTSNTAVSASHTALQSAITDSGLARASATVSQITTAQTNDTLKLTYNWTASASKTIEEIGVFNASSSGTMLARALTGSVSVISGNVLVGTYTWRVVGN